MDSIIPYLAFGLTLSASTTGLGFCLFYWYNKQNKLRTSSAQTKKGLYTIFQIVGLLMMNMGLMMSVPLFFFPLLFIML